MIDPGWMERISNLKLFRGFAEEELLRLFGSSGCKIARYRKGTLLHLQGELCGAMDLLLEGVVSVQKIDPEGNILKVGVFSSGELLGANLLFASRNTYPLTVAAETDAVVVHLYRQQVLELCNGSESFTEGLLHVISDRTLVLTDKIDAISMRTIRASLTEYFRYESNRQKSREIRLEISKKELAERLGIRRTSLSREFQKMKKDGLIDYRNRSVILLDRSL